MTWNRRRFILGFTFLATTGSIGVSLLLPNHYEATTTIMATEQPSKGGILNIQSMMGFSLPNQSATSMTYLTNILNSRSLCEKVVTQFNLKPTLFPNQYDSKRKQWKKNEPDIQDSATRLKSLFIVRATKPTSTISITVRDTRPAVASEIANDITTTLENYIQNNIVTSAKQKSIFISNQIGKKSADLENLNRQLVNFSDSSRTLLIDRRLSENIVEISRRFQELSIDAFSLRFSQKYFPDQTDVQAQLKKEISTIEDSLKKRALIFSSNPSSSDNPRFVVIPFEKIPLIAMEYVQMKREAVFLAEIIQTLRKELELSKIEEAKEDIHFNILDSAVTPKVKSSPHRSKIVVTFFMGSFLLSVAWIVFLGERFRHWKALISRQWPK